MDAAGIDRSLTRMAHEILERNRGIEDLAVVGIQTGGAFLAARLQRKLREIEGRPVPLGVVDITLYRDDLRTSGQRPLGKTDISFSLDGKKVILVDDVLFTGRTIRAAMDALIDFGRPRRIQLAVLIDRGQRELPIQADFIGMILPSSPLMEVTVRLLEKSGCDEVIVGPVQDG